MTRGPVTWRTSSFSSNGSNCVEVLELADGTWLRDTKDRRGPALHCDPAGWRAFLDTVAGTPPGRDAALHVRAADDGGCRVEQAGSARALHFTAGEWSAFRAGVVAGEFGPVRGRLGA